MSKKLNYLRLLTDDFGVWQHSIGEEIDWGRGYALDDSARALIVFLDFNDKARAKVCLDYITKSQTDKGFVGFYDRNRKPLDKLSSNDAHALAIWALATAVERGFYADQAMAIIKTTPTKQLIDKGYLRTLAYLLLAYCALRDKPKADHLAKLLTNCFDPKLGWFEDRLTYANAALPLALLKYRRTFNVKDKKLQNIIVESIETLEKYCRIGVIPAPVGNRIWQRIGSVERDVYGQQPIDSGFMVVMLVEAYKNFGDAKYLSQAKDWLSWFTGNNIYKTSMIDKRYACADGLDEPPRAKHENRGSESTIMYLMAVHSLR